MTEQEWLACTDPKKMLEFLRSSGQANARKLQLLALAYLRWTAILADALEEAGCHDLDILAHCRQPGEHVRGCWVVDLLLGKE